MIHWNSWWDVIIGLAGSVTLGIQYPSKLSVVYICCLEALCLVSTNLRVKYLPPECTAVFPVKLCVCRLFAVERSLHVFTLSFQWTETRFPVWQLSPYSFSHCYCLKKKSTVPAKRIDSLKLDWKLQNSCRVEFVLWDSDRSWVNMVIILF